MPKKSDLSNLFGIVAEHGFLRVVETLSSIAQGLAVEWHTDADRIMATSAANRRTKANMRAAARTMETDALRLAHLASKMGKR